MVCLGVKPGAAVWKAQTNPLSYGGTPKSFFAQNSIIYLLMTTVLLGSSRILVDQCYKVMVALKCDTSGI